MIAQSQCQLCHQLCHQLYQKLPKLQQFFHRYSGISNNNTSLEQYVAREDVQNAEVIWAMRLIEKHQSYRSCDDIQRTFTAMFPDIGIAKKMSIARTKAKYLINHELAPYFAEELTIEIKESGKIVACFDEVLNNVAQRGQMDISVRFWEFNNIRVSTRYFNSVFLNHARAEDLLAGFKQGMKGIPLSETMQVSMDGPHVNWKFIELLEDDEDFTKNGKQLLELLSCGLHAVHGAFQTGHKAAEWNVNEVL